MDHSQTIGGDTAKLLGGYIPPGFGTPDLNKHRKAVRGAAASTKMTNYFVTAGGK